MPSSSRRVRAVGVAAVAAASSMLLASCGLTSLTLASHGIAQGSAASITTAPALGSKDAAPGRPLVVKVDSGRITGVVVKAKDGSRLRGTVSKDGTTWVSKVNTLGYGATYDVKVDAVDREGFATTSHDTIKTLAPKTKAVSYISPIQDSVVGVGMPITVQFDYEVRRKAAVEKRLKVVSPAGIEGSWYWMDDKLVEFRPKTYWPANTEIKVAVPLVGVELAPGIWGEKNRVVSFRTGDAMVSKVNMDSHELTVIKNGTVIRTIPITTGKNGFETRSGVKVVMGKERTRLMDAATGGTDPNSPEYYRLTVEYAMRLTWSGEFLHAAPWSVGSQGSANVSHGCTGMSTGDAAWLYSHTREGDVFVYSAGHAGMELDNGIGGIWNLNWDQLKSGSAIKA